MEHEFWHERWGDNRIAFHEGRPNDLLVASADDLPFADGDTVFVPLCGKSVDLVYLAERGCRVIGVELSEIAARAFFEENGLAFTDEDDGPFRTYRGDRVTIHCGDVFELDAARLSTVTAVYDRAALVALPDGMRERYAAHLQAVLPAGAPMLVVAFEYRQEEMDGPPFSVPPATVERLYGETRSIETLRSVVFEKDHPLAGRGLGRLEEHALRVGPAGSA